MAAVGAAACVPLLPGSAWAGVGRALRLEELVRRSPHVLRGTPLEAYSEWVRIGGERRIVTYTRLRVDDAIHGADEPELLVRTLGGSVGKLGQLVPNEAQLLIGEPCLGFLMPVDGGVLAVTGMAQGHYALKADASGTLRLAVSGEVAALLDDKQSAVSRLSARSFGEARDLIRQVRR